MKIAIVYNRHSKNAINLFGNPNQEKIGLKTIKRISDALRESDHVVTSFEADKDLISRLEEFMPSVVKGERPGMVFNVSYGLQGQARYSHVPSILEMVGIPYLASGPLAHSLALDKVVAKMIFEKQGIPTPQFGVLESVDDVIPNIEYPMIVKPKNEAVSFGVKIVSNEQELRDAAAVIFDKYRQAVLVERYIEGREINVGVIGNHPPEPFLPAELIFGAGGPNIYTYEDKTKRSGREVSIRCPAELSPELTQKVQQLAVQAFSAIGCMDCARVDMRIDKFDNPYILEINSLPSLGEHGSYVEAAACAGLDYPNLVNRLIEVASARYFATPHPPSIDPTGDPQTSMFQFLTERRDQIEKRVQKLASRHVRTEDTVGVREYAKEMDQRLQKLGMCPIERFSDQRSTWAWETEAGMSGGVLLVLHADVPIAFDNAHSAFRREAQWLVGEGIASVHAPWVVTEYALRALKRARKLQKVRMGVLCFTDEGRSCQDSEATIARASAEAGMVLVLNPAGLDGQAVVQRRGLRTYRLTVDGQSTRLGRVSKEPEVMRWMWRNLERIATLTNKRERVAISATEIKAQALPMRLPQRVIAQVVLGYPNQEAADRVDSQIRAMLGQEKAFRWQLVPISDRPAMQERAVNADLLSQFSKLAERFEFPFGSESSLWPSAAGIVEKNVPVLCGLAPIGKELHTSHEAVQRIGLLQRSLLISHFLLEREGGP